MKTTILADEFFTVKTWMFNESVMEFEIAQIESLSLDGLEATYEMSGSRGSFDKPTTDFDKALKFMRGSIKWDGCANYTFPEQEEVALHACGLCDFKKIYTVMKLLYAQAAVYMPDSKENLLEKK